MTTCAVCGGPIYPTNANRDRPWLHMDGMAYEDRGIAHHKAIPTEQEPPT